MENRGLIPGRKEPKKSALIEVPEAQLAMLDKRCSGGYIPFPNIPFSPQIGTRYHPGLAQWMINATLCAYARYCKKGDTATPDGLTGIHPLYWHEGLSLFKAVCGFVGMISSTDGKKRMLITYRGTETTREWLDNFYADRIYITPAPFTHSIMLHQGFWNVYHKHPHLDRQVHHWIEHFAPDELYITGHSLGGAIATITLVDVLLRYPSIRSIAYTLGSPRVGDPSLSTLLTQMGNDPTYQLVSWRMVNTEDIVPTVPLPALGPIIYSHLIPSSSIGTFTFSDNLGSIHRNHHPVTYFYGATSR